MRSDLYGEGYFEHGVGSNYCGYGWDAGWTTTVKVLLEAGVPEPWFEVGCAKGWFVHAARRAGVAAEGVDVSEWAVENCAPDVAEWVFLGNALDLPWADGSAGAVVSWEVLEHVPVEDVEDVLMEMDRVVRPGGSIVARICLEGSDADGTDADSTHVTVVPKEWWLHVAERAGWVRDVRLEKCLDDAFEGRDWSGRFLSWVKPLPRVV